MIMVGGAWWGCAWWGMHGTHAPQQILHDTVNERAVRILLECILVIIGTVINYYSEVHFNT